MPTERVRTRTPRITGRLIVAVLVATVVTAALAGCAGDGRGVVPAGLVGVWRGGAHSNGSWCYQFSADGTYRAWPERSPGTMNAGTVIVDHTTIWFSNGGAPVRSTWTVSDGVLLLDGKRFVRAPHTP